MELIAREFSTLKPIQFFLNEIQFVLRKFKVWIQMQTNKVVIHIRTFLLKFRFLIIYDREVLRIMMKFVLQLIADHPWNQSPAVGGRSGDTRPLLHGDALSLCLFPATYMRRKLIYRNVA